MAKTLLFNWNFFRNHVSSLESAYSTQNQFDFCIKTFTRNRFQVSNFCYRGRKTSSGMFFGKDVFVNSFITFARVGRIILTAPPVFFCKWQKKTAARSAAVFLTTFHASISHPSRKIQPKVIPGQVTRSGQGTLPQKYSWLRWDHNF